MHSGVILASDEPDSLSALHGCPAKLNLTVAGVKLHRTHIIWPMLANEYKHKNLKSCQHCASCIYVFNYSAHFDMTEEGAVLLII